MRSEAFETAGYNKTNFFNIEEAIHSMFNCGAAMAVPIDIFKTNAIQVIAHGEDSLIGNVYHFPEKCRARPRPVSKGLFENLILTLFRDSLHLQSQSENGAIEWHRTLYTGPLLGLEQQKRKSQI